MIQQRDSQIYAGEDDLNKRLNHNNKACILSLTV